MQLANDGVLVNIGEIKSKLSTPIMYSSKGVRGLVESLLILHIYCNEPQQALKELTKLKTTGQHRLLGCSPRNPSSTC